MTDLLAQLSTVVKGTLAFDGLNWEGESRKRLIIAQLDAESEDAEDIGKALPST